MKMDHYLSHTDYLIWQVIQNSNGPVSITTCTKGMIKVLPPKTTEEVVARERERKARTTLLMALPVDHLAKFHKMANAKEIWEDIKSRFVSNDESKKMQKYLLKQQFEGFSVSALKGLHKGYDRFQTLLSQLEIHGANVSHEDANQKFLRSLPSSWSQVALIMITKPGLDTLSFNGLYNNLRVFERDVKGTISSSSSNTQNVAFVSADNTSSTNDVSTAYSVSSPSVSKSYKEGSSSYTDEINDDDIEEMDLKWQMALMSMRIKKFHKRTGRKDGGYNGNKAKDNRRRPTYQDDSKALVTIDEEDIDWYGHVEEDTQNYAMMAYSSNNPGSKNKVKSCSKTCAESYARLKKLYNEQRDKLDAKTYENTSCESDSSVETTTSVSALVDNAPKVICEPKVWTDAPIIEEYESDSDDDSVENVKETGTPNHCPKVVNMDRNGHTIKGLGYAFTRKSCFVCSSFGHLIRDCDFHKKRMAKQVALTKSKDKVTGQRDNRPVWNNVQRVKHQNKNMTWNKAHLADYQEFKGGSIAFGDSNGRITGKGKIKASRLDFEDVYYVEELKHYNLFSVLQMCDKKNKVLFTDTDCLMISPDFKLPDENQKGKQHKASCKAKTVSSVNQPLQILHMDLFGPTTVKSINHKTYCLVITDGFNRPFGCHVTILNTIDQLGKFDGKSNSGFLVGYSSNRKVFRVYNLETKRVEENLHVNLLENKPNVAGKGHAWMFDLDYLTNSMKYEPVLVENQANKSAGPKEANHSAGTQANNDQELRTKTEKTTDCKTCKKPASQVEQIFQEELEKLKRQEKEANDAVRKEATYEYQDANTNSTNLLNVVSAPISTVGPSKALNDDEPSYLDDPSMPYLEDIYTSPSEGIFTDSSYNDKGVLFKQEVKCTRILKLILLQEEGIDYNEVFALMARIEAIRIFLAFASYMGFIVYQIDMNSAFLYGTIDEEVYVTQPPGFVDPKYPNKVYKVVKALYGLHQAPRAWYATLSTFLEKSGYRRRVIDKILFIKQDKKDIMLVQVYVDDIIFGSTKKYWCDEFEELIKNRFRISSMGELTFFLGLQVKEKEDGIFISQHKFVTEILKKFDFLSVKTASTLIETQDPLVKDEEAADVDVHLYKSMIGSLMYLTASRPDIMFAVCACSRFQVTPKTSHLQAVKRIFRLYSKELASPKQTALGKDESNSLIVDSLLKTIWLSMHHVIAMKHWLFQSKRLLFWATSSIKKVNDVVKLQALIDRKKVIITEDIICQDLQLDDADGVECLPTKDIFEELAHRKFKFSKYIIDSMAVAEEDDKEDEVCAAPTPPSPTHEPTPPSQEPITSPPQDQPAPPSSPPQEQPITTFTSDRTLLNTLLETCTTLSHKVVALEQDKFSQALKIYKLKRRVKRLEKKRRLKHSGLKRAQELHQQYDQKQENIDWNVVAEQMQEKHLDNIRKYQSLKRKPISIAQARKNMIVYLKNIAGYKMAHFKGSHSTQDTPTDDPKEMSKEDVKNMLEIIPVSEFKVEALQVKEDLDALWRLAKEKFNTKIPTEDREKALWVELKRLYKPNAADVFWKLQRYMHDPWKLYTNYGVHQVSSTRRHDIFMFTEKDYPLTDAVLLLMLSMKLQVDEDCEMARDLMMKIFIEANKPKSRRSASGGEVKEGGVVLGVVKSSFGENPCGVIEVVGEMAREAVEMARAVYFLENQDVKKQTMKSIRACFIHNACWYALPAYTYSASVSEMAREAVEMARAVYFLENQDVKKQTMKV
uniref:Retrovirus-related Pol polyprotein from transposon TNT 1-94 n=1 Tax=Tanacetum cinerariifolium TaxID=118510 RepID=A0A6L2J5Q3_TANCI|nr:retrovirus-related Pol polyprotein from transposon TNT 1-94 [Tanacetum cinerariifolium]